eukprot:GAHX01002663.1.p1 GENE.GAHX01002663.1~~GAHX01002663.1.p1  ORF type:complete len:223 (+),score=27.02 GAHX01002663.1:2-670(+)
MGTKFKNFIEHQMKKQTHTKPTIPPKDSDLQPKRTSISKINYNLPHSCDENCTKFKCCNDYYQMMDYNPSNSIYSLDEPIENIVFNFSKNLYQSFERAYDYRNTPNQSKNKKHIRVVLAKEKKERNSVLVLDLDQTLVFTEISSNLFNKKNVGLEVTNENFAKQQLDFYTNGRSDGYSVTTRFRPYLEYFLDEASKYFDLAIYTASERNICRSRDRLLSDQI